MKTQKSFALRFYVPIATACFLVLLVIFSPKVVTDYGQVDLEGEVSVLGVKLPIQMWVQRVVFIRCILLFAAIACVFKALNIDFSHYFPQDFKMDVYFDPKGIERNLLTFSERDRADLDLAEDWRARISTYDALIKDSLVKLRRDNRLPPGPEVSEFMRELQSARGETTFVIMRIGPLAYRLTESEGYLDYSFDVPKKPSWHFRGSFRLRDSAHNHIRPPLFTLLKTPSFIIRPEFRQTFSGGDSNSTLPFDHVIIGLTKVVLLPFPSFSNTLYLWKQPDGKTIPIAYCIYY